MEAQVIVNDTPVPFGYKMGWLAIRGTVRNAVVQSLQLSDPVGTTWQAGTSIAPSPSSCSTSHA